MEITGRITRNAEVKTVSGYRTVVNFSIAVNDRYKPKRKEVQETTNFFNCSYWMGEGIAKHLTKGALVQVTGRLSVQAWKDMQGEPRASLNLHVNEIKLLAKSGNAPAPGTAAAITEPVEDLPF